VWSGIQGSICGLRLTMLSPYMFVETLGAEGTEALTVTTTNLLFVSASISRARAMHFGVRVGFMRCNCTIR
jgi:hypothetical protein